MSYARGGRPTTPSRRTALRAVLARTLVIVLAAAVPLAPGLVAAQGLPPQLVPLQDLPPAATPGGAQPREPVLRPPPESDEEIFPIPPMIERPLGVDEGPKIQVEKFIVLGRVQRPAEEIYPEGFDIAGSRSLAVADRPERGIYAQEIERLLEAERRKRPEGFTIGQLQEVANAVTRYLRERGQILSTAYIPEQDVRDGVVKIEILEGILGDVVPEGNEMYSDKRLVRPFRDLVGEPVTNDEVESAILRLTDYPGLVVFGVFRPGDQLGETDLALRVQDEQRVEVGITADNHGSRFTGQERLRADLAVNNVSGAADVFRASVLQTFNPTNGTYGLLNYERPVGAPGHAVGFGVSSNTFDVGDFLSSLGIDGEVYIANLYYDWGFVRSRRKNLYFTVDLSAKRAIQERQGVELFRDEILVLTPEFSFDTTDGWGGGGINQGTIQLGIGDVDGDPPTPTSRRDENGEFVQGSFQKLVVYLARLQSLTRNQSLLLRLQGQYSPDPLVSVEQFAIGGPYTVRAYPTAEFLGDSAAFGSIEWIINAPGFANARAFGNRTWGEFFQVSVFVDGATAKLNDLRFAQEDSVDLSGAGLGLQFSLPGTFLARVDVASPITSRDPSDDRDPQYWVSIGYNF